MPCYIAELYHFSLWVFVGNEPVFYAMADCKSITYCSKITELNCINVPFSLSFIVALKKKKSNFGYILVFISAGD